MTATNLSLGRVKSVTQALDRTPQGRDFYELAVRLGLVTPGYAHPEERPEFHRKFSELTPDQLSDLMGQWTSEYGRLVELMGTINGQLKLLSIQEKAARAAARSRARKAWPEDERKPTRGDLDDLAEEDSEVIDILEMLAYVELLGAQVKATLEATKKYLDGIDKEIILRTAQMKARIYG